MGPTHRGHLPCWARGAAALGQCVYLPVRAGLGVGLVAALALRRWVGPLLVQTSPSDPRVMLGVAALLLGVAGVAALVPTARALRRDPAAVLRVDWCSWTTPAAPVQTARGG